MTENREEFINEFSVHLSEQGVGWDDTETVLREYQELYPDLPVDTQKLQTLMTAKEELLLWFYTEASKLVEASDSEPQTQQEFNELVFEGENSLYSQLIDKLEERLNQNLTD